MTEDEIVESMLDGARRKGWVTPAVMDRLRRKAEQEQVEFEPLGELLRQELLTPRQVGLLREEAERPAESDGAVADAAPELGAPLRTRRRGPVRTLVLRLGVIVGVVFLASIADMYVATRLHQKMWQSSPEYDEAFRGITDVMAKQRRITERLRAGEIDHKEHFRLCMEADDAHRLKANKGRRRITRQVQGIRVGLWMFAGVLAIGGAFRV